MYIVQIYTLAYTSQWEWITDCRRPTIHVRASQFLRKKMVEMQNLLHNNKAVSASCARYPFSCMLNPTARLILI